LYQAAASSGFGDIQPLGSWPSALGRKSSRAAPTRTQ
jgi:hypothetical protein